MLTHLKALNDNILEKNKFNLQIDKFSFNVVINKSLNPVQWKLKIENLFTQGIANAKVHKITFLYLNVSLKQQF